MTECRHKHAAILLPSGKVLIAGGSDNRDWHGEYSSAETLRSCRWHFPPDRPDEYLTIQIAGSGGFAEERQSADCRRGPFRRSLR
jgi:hypothetical protein